ncbi:hypothetical protein [Nocardia yunnanensis]|uniref:hypothetical protein n=1 Tax=Nocardia yunnanensis TaxID=2382165 RepID=UPI0013C48A53|nr:hypothetical protein [Nocardia yunnanensis]
MVRFVQVARPVAIALTAVAMLAACAPDVAPKYRIPDRLGFNFRWSAEPGVGLTTDAAIIARAFMESAFISYETHHIDSDRPEPNEYSYPGYERAYPRLGADEMVIGGITMAGLGPDGVVGTFYAHMLEVKTVESAQPQTAQDSPPEWQATMCVWVDALDLNFKPNNELTANTHTAEAGYYPFMNYGSGPHESGTGRTVRLTMQQPPAGRQGRLSSGEGSARYPTTNVFGEWKITKANMTDSGPGAGADSGGAVNICADRLDNPVPSELRNRDYQAKSDVPAPTLDPYPGWPAHQ